MGEAYGDRTRSASHPWHGTPAIFSGVGAGSPPSGCRSGPGGKEGGGHGGDRPTWSLQGSLTDPSSRPCTMEGSPCGDSHELRQTPRGLAEPLAGRSPRVGVRWYRGRGSRAGTGTSPSDHHHHDRSPCRGPRTLPGCPALHLRSLKRRAGCPGPWTAPASGSPSTDHPRGTADRHRPRAAPVERPRCSPRNARRAPRRCRVRLQLRGRSLRLGSRPAPNAWPKRSVGRLSSALGPTVIQEPARTMPAWRRWSPGSWPTSWCRRRHGSVESSRAVTNWAPHLSTAKLRSPLVANRSPHPSGSSRLLRSTTPFRLGLPHSVGLALGEYDNADGGGVLCQKAHPAPRRASAWPPEGASLVGRSQKANSKGRRCRRGGRSPPHRSISRSA